MVAAPGFDAPAAVVGTGAPPLLVTRVGREHPGFAAGVEKFLEAASDVEVIDVPEGQHSFDIADHTDESRAAVRRAVEWVRERQAV
jgi:hypothetical protein